MTRLGYVTATEASAIIAGYLAYGDAQRAAWDALEDADKSAYLAQALIKLERIPYQGRKADPDQALQFPRWPQSAVPTAVKEAQALEACALVGTSADAALRAQLQAQGVTSFGAGNISETYGQGSSGVGTLYSQLARDLLKPQLLGVIPIV